MGCVSNDGLGMSCLQPLPCTALHTVFRLLSSIILHLIDILCVWRFVACAFALIFHFSFCLCMPFSSLLYGGDGDRKTGFRSLPVPFNIHSPKFLCYSPITPAFTFSVGLDLSLSVIFSVYLCMPFSPLRQGGEQFPLPACSSVSPAALHAFGLCPLPCLGMPQAVPVLMVSLSSLSMSSHLCLYSMGHLHARSNFHPL